MNSRVFVAVGATASIALAAVVAPATIAAAAASRPAAVTNLAPFEKSGPVTLSWTNPREIDRDVVRLARGAVAPRNTHSGRAVALARPRAARLVLRKLVPGRQYSVSVWTKRDGVLSRRASTSFTAKPAAAPGTARRGVIAGTVRDTSGDPLDDAFVLVVDYDTFSHDQVTTTSGTGAFRLTVPQGRYFIAAFGDTATGGTSDATGYVPAFRDLPVRTGQKALRFVLADGGELVGTVTDSHGTPLRNVQVGLFGAPTYLDPDNSQVYSMLDGPGSIVRTGSNGRFRVRGLAGGAFVACFATGGARGGATDVRGYVSRCDNRSSGVTGGVLTTAETVALDTAPRVAKTAFGSIAGTVTSGAGKPVAHRSVFAQKDGSKAVGVSGRTDATGHFALHKLAPGHWTVCAEAGFDYACKRVKVVARHTATAALRFQPVGTLSGVVRGPSGLPAAAGEAIAEHRTAHGGEGEGVTVGPDGQFNLDALSPGNWKVCFSGGLDRRDATGARSGCIAKQIGVVAGRDRIGVDKTLAPGGAVAGSVTDSGGQPLRNVGVLVYGGRNDYDLGNTAVTDAHGRFEVAGLDPGRYQVCAEIDYATGGTRSKCTSERVDVVAKRVARSGAIVLPDDAALAVTVTDAADNPLSGVDVAILHGCPRGDYCTAQPVFDKNAGVNVASSADTDDTGQVRFDGMRPGHYVACALAYYAASATAQVPDTGYADKCTGSTFSINVRRGGVATAKIALDPAAAVSGVVRDSAGKPLNGVEMRVGSSAAFDYTSETGVFGLLFPSPEQGTRTRPDGKYLVRSVQPGSRKVCAVPPGSLDVRRGCVSGRVALTAGTVTQAPALTLADRPQAARAAARLARIESAMPLSFVRQQRRFMSATHRIPVVSSTGMPEFRVPTKR